MSFAGRYRLRMAKKRSTYDPLQTVREPRWLARLDKFSNVIDCRRLAPGADLRATLTQGIEALRKDGWTIEGLSFGGTFVNRAGERHYIGIYPTDPHLPVANQYGPAEPKSRSAQ